MLNFPLNAQSATDDFTEIFDLVFSPKNFDSAFYREEFQVKTFFVLKEGAILSFVDAASHEHDLLLLKNGDQVAFNSKGWMFMIDVKYYLNIKKMTIDSSECLIEIDFIEFNGLVEKKVGSMSFLCLKNENIWSLSEVFR